MMYCMVQSSATPAQEQTKMTDHIDKDLINPYEAYGDGDSQHAMVSLATQIQKTAKFVLDSRTTPRTTTSNSPTQQDRSERVTSSKHQLTSCQRGRTTNARARWLRDGSSPSTCIRATMSRHNPESQHGDSTTVQNDETLSVEEIEEGDRLSDEEMAEIGVLAETRYGPGHQLTNADAVDNGNIIARSKHADAPVSYILFDKDGVTLSLERHTRQLDTDNFTVVEHVCSSDDIEVEAVPLKDDIEDADVDSDVIEDVKKYHAETSEIMFYNRDSVFKGPVTNGEKLWMETLTGEELKHMRNDLELTDGEMAEVREALKDARPTSHNHIDSGGMITTHAVELIFK